MNQLKIAVIGVGRMGRYHVRVLSRLHSLCAIVDSNEEIENQIQDQSDSLPYFTDYREMIESVEPDGVILSIPTQYHYPIAKDLLENFSLKGILIEKPVTSTIEEAESLLDIIKNNSSTSVSIGHIEVHNPIITKILTLIEQKTIGKIRSIIFQRRGAVSDGRLESIGDVYQDIGIHDFDIATRFLSGTYQLSAFSIEHNKLINSSTVVLHSKSKNINCTFLISREFAGKIRSIEIEGTHATMIANLLDQYVIIRQLGIAKGDTNSISVPFGSGEQIKVYGEPLLFQIWHFLDTMNGAQPLVSILDGIKSLKIVESARQSSKTGMQVEVEL